MNVLNNYTTNNRYQSQNLYRFPSAGFNNVVTYRNTHVPNFKSCGNGLTLKNKLYNEVQRLKNIHGYTIVFNLAMVGIAALAGLLGKFENSDYINTLKSKIQNFDINNVPKEKITPDEQTVEEPQTSITEESDTGNVSEEKPVPENKVHKKIVTNEEIQRRYEQLIAEKPERKEFFIYLEDYPELRKKYKKLIIKKAINDSDKTNRDNIKGIECVLRRLPQLQEGYYDAENNTKNKRFNPDDFLKNMNTTYMEYFEDICSLLYKEKELARDNKGGSTLQVMHLIAKNQLEAEYIKNYLKYPNLTYNEFISTKNNGIENLMECFDGMKGDYSLVQYRLVKSIFDDDMPNFAIQFNLNLDTQDRIKVIMEFFEKLHGKVLLHTDKVPGQVDYTLDNLYDELFARLRKDKTITPLYNFVKFVNPNALKEYNYTIDEVNKLVPHSKEYIEIKRKIGYALAYLEDSDKLEELMDVINNKDMFHKYIDNLHSILRFICRFVLNNKLKPDFNFKEECAKRTMDLKTALKTTLEKSALIQTYKYRKGIAPRFYLHKDNNLGENIRIALNMHGQIHTIYQKIDSPNKFALDDEEDEG